MEGDGTVENVEEMMHQQSPRSTTSFSFVVEDDPPHRSWRPLHSHRGGREPLFLSIPLSSTSLSPQWEQQQVCWRPASTLASEEERGPHFSPSPSLPPQRSGNMSLATILANLGDRQQEGKPRWYYRPQQHKEQHQIPLFSLRNLFMPRPGHLSGKQSGLDLPLPMQMPVNP